MPVTPGGASVAVGVYDAVVPETEASGDGTCPAALDPSVAAAESPEDAVVRAGWSVAATPAGATVVT